MKIENLEVVGKIMEVQDYPKKRLLKIVLEDNSVIQAHSSKKVNSLGIMGIECVFSITKEKNEKKVKYHLDRSCEKTNIIYDDGDFWEREMLVNHNLYQDTKIIGYGDDEWDTEIF